MQALLERKLEQLQRGREQMEANLKAQDGAIQVVQQLIAECVEEAAKAAMAEGTATAEADQAVNGAGAE